MRQSAHKKKETATGVASWIALRPEVTEALLADVTRRIVEKFDPEKVILFGSYAYGEPDIESDVDLLVIMHSDEPMVQRMVRVSEVAEVRFLPMDVLVYTPAEIERRLEMGDFFIIEILTKGRVLYHRDTERDSRGTCQIGRARLPPSRLRHSSHAANGSAGASPSRSGEPTRPSRLVDEWVEKAEAEYKAAVALGRSRKEPLPDIVCFHCQQSAEKYLKAYLIAQGDIPPRTHALDHLLDLAVKHDATLAAQLPLALLLNPYGVAIRYPEASATVAEARDVVDAIRKLRAVLRGKLGL